MWLYPVPAIVALAGWTFLLLTSGWFLIALGLGTLALGVVCFLVWSWRSRRWPFQRAASSGGVKTEVVMKRFERQYT